MKILLLIVLSFTLYGQEMRGFVVEDSEGHLFLADTPALRSCCVRKPGRAIQLVGDFGKLSRFGAVTVSGKLVETSDGLKLVADGLAEPNLFSEKVPAD